MTRMLVVASPTLTPLSTAGPLPTDGLPGWWRCERCGMRELPDTDLIYTEHETPDGDGVCQADAMVPDGPFPFTVAVWQEVECWECGGRGEYHDIIAGTEGVWGCNVCRGAGTVGAVVATVEVAGPSHHADECRADPASWEPGKVGFTHTDMGLPDCWHTPTSTVTRLDVPIPMERPSVEVDGAEVVIDERGLPFWWADLPLEVPA